MKRLLLLLATMVFVASSLLKAQNQKQNKGYHLTHEMSYEEWLKRDLIGKDFTPTNPPPPPVRMVAEFEPMSGVYVAYDSWSGFGIPTSSMVEMAEDAIVNVIVTGSNQSSANSELSSAGANMSNVYFLNAPTDSWWVRDYGPWYVVDGNDEFGVCNYPYNRPRPNDNDIPIEVANDMGINLWGMDITHTGGNYMCDGMGVAASTDLVYDENSWTPSEIDSFVNDFLGVHTYHLLPDPLGDYIEHIDCWGKFLDVDKVLIGQVPESDPRYDDYEYVADYFANETSSYGVPYEVYRVYTPASATTPYTNSLILNNKVFVPLSGSQFDDEAIDAYQQAMPGYNIIGVTSSGWYDTDALHCRTKGQADINMLYIRHIPLASVPATKEDYTINAHITPYSGQNLYADSLMVFYKVNQGNLASVMMNNIDSNYYQATIPQQAPNDSVFYYIHAADESGRSVNHPFIGQNDPHKFYVDDSGQPFIGLSVQNLDFGNTSGLKELTYTLSGSNLTSDINLTLVDGSEYSISDDGNSYSSSITIPQNNGTVEETTVYVQFHPSTLGIFTDSIMHESAGLTTQYLSLSGIGVENITELNNVDFTVSPNPTNGVIQVKGISNCEISIINTAGQVIKHQEIHENNALFNISEYPQGVYFVKVEKNNTFVMKKVIKY